MQSVTVQKASSSGWSENAKPNGGTAGDSKFASIPKGEVTACARVVYVPGPIRALLLPQVAAPNV